MTTEYKPIILHVAHGTVTGTIGEKGGAELSLHTSMDALIDGLRKMYRTDATSGELLTDLLAGLAGALERDAVYGSEVEPLRALLAEQVARAERAEREMDEIKVRISAFTWNEHPRPVVVYGDCTPAPEAQA